MSRARVVPGETVLVIGIGGGVATFALNIAKAAGCRVVVTSSSNDKLAAARELGADVGVNYAEAGDDWPAAVKEANGGGVDVVIDSVGSTWAGSIDACAPGGRVVVFGGTGGARHERSHLRSHLRRGCGRRRQWRAEGRAAEHTARRHRAHIKAR
jgi:NADPH:quinone reductase-like Zn-dependent oxidoreductase